MPNKLMPNKSLSREQYLTSPMGRFTLIYQTDGNLVLYKNYRSKSKRGLWSSNTFNNTAGRTVMQADGDLLVQDASGKKVWASNTAGHPDSALVLQDDGNLVLYDKDGKAVWSTDTYKQAFAPTGQAAQGARIQPGEILDPGQSLNSPNKQFTLVYQDNGDLVLYKNYRYQPRKVLWTSKTADKPAEVCMMRNDGNLVIILSEDGTPLWQSNTAGHPDSSLVIQDDGNVCIYDAANKFVWNTATAGQKFAPMGPAASGARMRPGQVLNPDDSITSSNGQFTFVYQSDGDLVLFKNYKNQPRKVLWNSKTAGKPAEVCIMQDDGNLVIFDGDGTALWSSCTWQHPGSSLVVQDDGNVCIYDKDGKFLWNTATAGQKFARTGPVAKGCRMQPGQILNPRQSVSSANGLFTLVYQDDGDLVLYKNFANGPGKRLWASNTAGKPAEVCALQDDGNLVIYDGDGRALWSSGTWQYSGSSLVVHNDGNVAIYDKDKNERWSTKTQEQGFIPAPADPYVIIQTVIAETKDQDLSYLAISEAQDPGRDLDLVTEEEAEAGVVPDLTSLGKTRVVHISGMKLVWDSKESASAAMMAYNNGADIGELNLYADTVVIREPILVPGGDVRIYARRVEFRDKGRIVTDPAFVQQTPVDIGVPGGRGARAGSVSLLVKPPGGETWPADMDGFASGLHIDKERPDGQALISARGGKGQKGGPGGATQVPRAFGPAESRGLPWFCERMAETPIWRTNGAAYSARVGTYERWEMWQPTVPGMGGGNVLRVIIQPVIGTDRDFKPINDWQAKDWPPRNGGDAVRAGKPGVGGKGGDLISTVKSAIKAKADIRIAECVDLAGGRSGAVGEVAKGGDPDSPNPYRVQKVDVFMPTQRRWDHLYIQTIKNSFETVTLSKGKDRAPQRPDWESGESGAVRDADHPTSWLHPFQVRAVIQYAKDLFLKGHREKPRALLMAYRQALNPTAPSAWPPALQIWSDELHELAVEVNMLLRRLEDSLDFFGNPVGWAPVLSLRSNLQIYNAEIDDAIKQLWFAYRVRTAFARVQDATKDLQDAVGTLNSSRKNMEQTLKDAQDRVPGLLVSLQSAQATYADRRAALEQRRDALLAVAKDDEKRKRIVTAVFGVIDAASSIIPVGQPYLKAAGSALNDVSTFFTSEPEDRSTALTKLAKTAGGLKDDLDRYKTSLTQTVSDKLDQYEKKSAEQDELATDQEKALDNLDAKVGLYSEIRTAKNAVSAKEREIDAVAGEIDAFRNQIEICTRNRPPVPKPPAKDTVEDRERRQMLDEIISEAKKELPDREKKKADFVKELTPLKDTLEQKTGSLARSEDRYEWSMKARLAKTEIASKKRELTQKKAEQSANIETWQRNLGNASEGLGKLAESVKRFTLPAEEVAARVNDELVKLEKKDPLYTELKETVGALDIEVTDLKGSLQTTQSDIDATTRGWIDNRRQTRALSDVIRRKSRVLDHFAVQYVDKMKSDAYERLIRYQYYIQKSFEYLFLAPCPYVDYQLTQMNDRILELLETSSGKPLTESDIALMKTLFQRPMIQIARHIVDLMQSKAAGRVAKFPVKLASHLIPDLNRGRAVRCSLVEAFGLPLSNANQRIDNIELVRAVLAATSGDTAESLRIDIRHLGPSIVRGMNALYCFSAGRPGGRSQWGFTWDVAGKTALTDPKTRETAAILALILGLPNDTARPNQMVSDLSEYYPGMLSDFEIGVDWVGEGARPNIQELHFQMTMPYEQTDDQSHLLHIKTNDGLKPLIDCGCLGDDSCGGFGNFFRLFRQGTSVYVSAPPSFGTRKFKSWDSTVSDSDDKLRNPRYVFKLSKARTLTAIYE